MLKSHQRRFAVPINNGVFRARWRDQKNSEQPLDGQKAKLDFGWVPLFTLCLTAFTAIAFGAGKAYRAHYLHIFGFTAEAIPWSFQDVVYLGITKQIDILLLPLMWLFCIALVLFLLSMLWKDFYEWFSAQRAKKSEGMKRTKDKSSTKSLLDQIPRPVKWLGFIFIGCTLAMFFVLKAEQRGKEDAEAAKKIALQGNREDSKMPYVTIERKVGAQKIIEAGYLFSCSERACGLYSPASDKKKEASRLVPMDGVTSFRYGD